MSNPPGSLLHQETGNVPTGTVTFLFTDVEGSTRMWEEHPRAMQAAVARHDALLREAIERSGGYVFKTVGDAFCAAFPTAPLAVDAALAAQRALVAADWLGLGLIRPIKARMALHTGVAEVRDNDYFGQSLNRVARLLSTGHGGQVLMTLATQQLVRDHLPPGIELKDLGEGGLRDLVHTEHVYQIVAPDLPAHFPPLRSLDSRYVEPDRSGRIVENPYKGLRAFHEGDADDFFGREALTERLLGRLAEAGPLSRFLAVVGPSGSGKSSVVRAGVVPALKRGALPGSERWLVVEMLPGPNPLEELEAVLLNIAVNPPERLINQLKEDERGLVRALKRVLPRDESVELALVIDQFEEVFTLVEDEPGRVHFLESLHAAVTDPRSRLRAIMTLRADFYDRPLLYPDPGELVRQRTEVVLPLLPEELERAIVKPAARVGVQMEPELLAAILQDVGEQPGTLPLLQYALTELFEGRKGRVLTLADYRASGGVSGALSRRAEAIYGGLNKEEQEAARQLFLRLVTLGEGVEDTRRRVRRAELASLVSQASQASQVRQTSGGDKSTLNNVVETFGQYRLLTFDRDPVTRDSTVEVAHEALIRTWPRLREWLAGSRERLRVQRQLFTASSEWAKSGKDPSFLASGARLAQFEALAGLAGGGGRGGGRGGGGGDGGGGDGGREGGRDGGRDGAASDAVALTSDEREYLEASVEARERERRARERLRRRITIGLAVGMLLTMILAAVAVVQSIQATEQKNVAVAEAQARATTQAISEQNRREAFSRELAAKSLSQITLDPNLSLLLAIEAGKAAQTDEATNALQRALIESQPHWVLSYPGNLNVNSAAFGPDSKSVVTAGNNSARVWEISDRTGNGGNIIAELPNPRVGNNQHSRIQWGISVAFSPDGKHVAVGTDGFHAWLWDLDTQELVHDLAGHTDVVNAVAFSPDGTRLVTASNDKTARVWDTTTGNMLSQFTSATGRLSSVAFSPDGKLAVTAGSDNAAQIWDTSSGKLVLTLTGHSDWVDSVAFSPDGKRVVTASRDHTVRVWDARSGKTLIEFKGHGDRVDSAFFSPDSKLVVSGSADNTALVWDAGTGQVLAQIKGSKIAPDSAFSAANVAITPYGFSPDGKYVLFVMGRSAWIYPWELFTPLDHLMTIAPKLAPRQLTCEERQTYMHEANACGTPTPAAR